ncbi:MAG: hypothetical protein CMB11_08205 [Euryarchaeota archaeon]|nr:hypothetical protein [Euryarchaeota archaeon]
MGGTLNEAFDPRSTNVAEVSGGGEALSDLRPVCHALYVLADQSANATLLQSDGWSTSGTPLEESECRSEWEPMTVERGVFFVRVAAWEVETSGEHLIQLDADEDVEAWLVDVPAMEQGMLSSPWVLTAFALCGFGVLVLPVGLTLLFSERRRRGQRIMMVAANGQLQPVSPGGMEAFGVPTQPREHDLPFDPITGAYRQAERPSTGADVAPDGMLTTEQVYALMRGDIEGALPPEARQDGPRDPFVATSRRVAPAPAESTAPSTTAPEPSSGKDWQSWDEGP